MLECTSFVTVQYHSNPTQVVDDAKRWVQEAGIELESPTKEVAVAEAEVARIAERTELTCIRRCEHAK